MATEVKRCSGCKNNLPLTSFNRDRAKKLGVCSRCRDCNRKTCAAWIRDNPERKRKVDRQYRELYGAERRAYQQKWVKENPDLKVVQLLKRRALVKGASVIAFTAQQLDDKMRYWGYRCWMCHGPFECVDHVKPLAVGGLHILANLRPACSRCNRRKHAIWPWDTRRAS